MRTELHKTVRQLFKGNLDSETDTTSPNDDDDGLRISIRWVRGGGRGGAKNIGKGLIPVPHSSQWRFIEMYAQVAVEIGHLGGIFPRTYISRYKKRIVIHTTLSRTLPGSFTQT